jgi:hypothetical protein
MLRSGGFAPPSHKRSPQPDVAKPSTLHGLIATLPYLTTYSLIIVLTASTFVYVHSSTRNRPKGHAATSPALSTTQNVHHAFTCPHYPTMNIKYVPPPLSAAGTIASSRQVLTRRPESARLPARRLSSTSSRITRQACTFPRSACPRGAMVPKRLSMDGGSSVHAHHAHYTTCTLHNTTSGHGTLQHRRLYSPVWEQHG